VDELKKRGRPPRGPDVVSALDGSEHAKERLRVILETVAGQMTIAAACAELGIGEAAFHKLRQRALEAGIQGLEPKPRGRPPSKEKLEDERLKKLEQENEQLRLELIAADLREQLARLGLGRAEPAPAPPKKKRTRSRRKP
jgi:transposase-like protein